MKPQTDNIKAQGGAVAPGPVIGTIRRLPYAGLMIVAAALALLALRPESTSAVPANDNFAGAITVTVPTTGDIVAVADTTGATTQASEPVPCGLTGSTVWYTWTSPASAGTVVLDTYGSDFNTVLAVYNGTWPNLFNQYCNDNFGATRSGVAVNYTANTTYFIQVGGASGATGNLVLNMAAGATMLVDSIGNLNAADNSLNLVEAMLLARAGTATTGLNRNLTPAESALVLNAGEAGASGADIIHFSPTVFPSNSPATIGLVGSLPTIDFGFDNISGIGAGVIVDGGNQSVNCFTLDGADASIIEGLEIRRCADAINMSNGADNNRIGGTAIPGQANTLRENGDMGIHISGNGNMVVGNRIGTDKTGTLDMGNVGGVYVLSGQANRIGGPDAFERNIISGNGSGVITGPFASTTDIEANFVGVAADGLTPLGNDNAGISLSGSGESVDNNVISANDIGVSLASQGAFVRSNHIGTDATGELAVGNTDGVQINTGENNFIGQGALGNVISGNTGHGVLIMNDAWGNFVSGNRIGVDAGGTDALANGGMGVLILGNASSNAVGANFASARNIISGNQTGVVIGAGAGAKGSMTSFATSTPIPNLGTALSYISVLRHGVVTDVEVTINSITHPAVGELNISLYAPNGDTIFLSTLNGGSGDNYSFTKFDDEAATAITAGTAPFTGTWRPEESLADLDGIDPYGDWQLRVQDAASGANVGTLGTWTLHLTTQGNSVQGNHIGTNLAGTAAIPNSGNGVNVNGIGNLIGGTEAAARNVISGNAWSGIAMEGGATNTRTYSTNTFVAISDLSTVNSTITVPNEAKVTDVNVQLNISHTHDADLDIRLIAPDATQVELSTDNGGSGDNYGGTVFDDEAGTAITSGTAPFVGSFRPEGKLRALDGKDAGGVWALQVTDDAFADAGSIQGWSIVLTLAGNTVQGNYIGTNAAGSGALGNQSGGVALGDLSSGNLIGGDAPGAGNLISGNLGAGILTSLSSADSNTIQGNRIGTDASGSADLGNAGPGVDVRSGSNLIGGTSPGARNVVSGNDYGIWMQDAGATDNKVQGNYIGTNSAGSADLGANGSGVVVASANGNSIGGGTAGSGNVISGNGGQGVSLIAGSTGNAVQGNLIGTNAAGTQTIGNDVNGVWVSASSGNLIGGTTPGAGNVIGGSINAGIEIVNVGSGNNVLQGNYVGTDPTGMLDLGNAADGIEVVFGATPTTVGGAAPGASNKVAFNGGDGIHLTSFQGGVYPVNVSIRGNRIYKNDGLGINLGPDGVTPNDSAPDSDPGYNQLQNFPVITSVFVDTVLDTTTINGTIESAFSTFYPLDFYYSYECDASGHGEGEVFLGNGGTTTNASGIGNFSLQWDVEIPAGTFITATATDSAGNTSEFSACVAAFDDGDDDNDGYTDVNEGLIGTSPNDPCGVNWPSNLTDDGLSANKLDIQDVVSFLAPVRRLDSSPGPLANYNVRWDLAPGLNAPFQKYINIIDLTTVMNGTTGNPPMFGNTRAYGKTCPFTP